MHEMPVSSLSLSLKRELIDVMGARTCVRVCVCLCIVAFAFGFVLLCSVCVLLLVLCYAGTIHTRSKVQSVLVFRVLVPHVFASCARSLCATSSVRRGRRCD